MRVGVDVAHVRREGDLVLAAVQDRHVEAAVEKSVHHTRAGRPGTTDDQGGTCHRSATRRVLGSEFGGERALVDDPVARADPGRIGHHTPMPSPAAPPDA